MTFARKHPGPPRLVAGDSGDAADASLRAICSAGPERRHGLGPARARRQGDPDSQHARRHSRADGTPIALGYHTGHWEVGLLMEAAARRTEVAAARCLSLPTAPIRATAARRAPPACSTACPIATMRPVCSGRLIRSLPTRRGVIGVATCDKGLPAMMMALAAMHDLPCVLVPGGVTLLAEEGEDAGRVQSVGARFAHGQITLEDAAEDVLPRLCFARRRLPVPGNGGDLAGSRRGARPVAHAFGARALRSSHLARYGAAVCAGGSVARNRAASR